MNDVRVIGTSQIPHNTQKINEKTSWKKVSGKKRNRKSSEKISRK